MNYGLIKSIKDVHNVTNGNRFPLEGKGGARLGFSGMLNALSGGQTMEGWEVVTDNTTIFILIDDQSSCCESWGYISSDDNPSDYVGAELLDVVLTDTALENFSTKAKEEMKYLDEGGVQFVTFKTSKGDFQLAVYNAHNGYYGHGILVAVGDEIILSSTL
jgi:hypothetical protein